MSEDDLFSVGEQEDQLAQAISDLIEQLGDEESTQMFSELSMHELRQITVLAMLDDDVTRNFVQEYTRRKVSYKRKGRKELIDISQSLGSLVDKMHGDGDRWRDKLKGMI